MRIDCYGERADGARRIATPAREPSDAKSVGGATFLRFGAGSPAPIHRLSVDAGGIVRHKWAFGNWADSESLDYVPLEETLEVRE